MFHRFISAIVLLAAASALIAARATSDPAALVVHEWGTFTSIAGPDGNAVQWGAQAGPADLPCFVERSRSNPKGSVWGTVRMETPVLYFYADRDTEARVQVRFPQGVLTEWFPRAAVANGTIRWNHVTITPRASPDFPVETGKSHYYLARETDASPLVSGSDQERFLFYRGVGSFAPPIAATTAGDGSVTVWNPRGQPLGDVIVFENRGGATAFDARHSAAGETTLAVPALDPESASPAAELERMLVAGGLYPKEARAMVDTWRDSWFEEGARVFYVVQSSVVDQILPLAIDPPPAQTVRVFVGRLELLTPATQRAVMDALSAGDTAAVDKYSRFLEPIGKQLLAPLASPERARLSARLQAAVAASVTSTPQCR